MGVDRDDDQPLRQLSPLRPQPSDRVRAPGGGRTYTHSLALRSALVLTYLRLHIPQATVAALLGADQSDASRELRRLLPLIQLCLPCPLVWEVVVDDQRVPAASCLSLDELAEGRVLIDATEQRVSRPQDSVEQKAYYSGKKHGFTLKTQFVTDGQHHIEAISSAQPGSSARPRDGCDHSGATTDGSDAVQEAQKRRVE